MGIRFLCPACTKRINVKQHLAGRRGFCPQCGAPVQIPLSSQFASVPDDDSASHPAIPQTPGGSSGAKTQTAAAPIAGTAPAAGSATAPDGGVPVGRIVMSTVAVDPLAELPGAVWYVAAPGNSQSFGPADASTMHQWLHEGRVTAASLVWRQDWPDWRPASAVWGHLVGPPAPQGSPHGEPPAYSGSAPAPPPGGAVGSAAPSAAIYYRRRSSGWYAATVVVLVLLVAALAWVMYYVVTRGPATEEPTVRSTTRIDPSEPTSLVERNSV